MKVILTERVKSLGNVGEVVNVSSGYARNFLIPENLAMVADEGNRKVLEDQQRRLAKKVEAEKADAVGIKKKLDGLVLEYTKRVGANGKLFGTVTTNELSKSLEEKGLIVEKRQIIIAQPIKTVGSFQVKARLFKDVDSDFEVKIVIDPKQAEELKTKQELAEKKAKAKKEAEAKKAEAGEDEAVEAGETSEGSEEAESSEN